MTQNARQLPLSSIDSGGALNQQYVYDANGNVSSITDALDAARSKTMGYDALDRLTSATSASFGGNGIHQFSYDPLDNLRSWTLGGVKDLATYVYDPNNRLTSVLNTGGAAVHSFAYDLQGNLSNKNSVPHDFDFGNRLRAVPGLESYRYDGLGRRVMSAKASGAQTLWQYSQAGQLLFAWKGPTAQTTHEYVYLAGSLVATIDHAWPSNAITATKYQHTDALGSPIAMSNEAGTVIERTNYDPYGGPIGKVIDGIGYTGHVMDPLTGLTNMQQRYYDQGVGRFLSVDPVTALDNGDMRHLNRYAYAYNSPYRFTDPDGRCPMCIGAAVGGLLELGVQIVEIALDQRTEIEVTDIAVAAGAGAMGVGLVTTINRGAKLGSVARAALEVGGDAAVSASSQLAKDGKVSIADTAVDVVLGQTVGSEAGQAAASRARSSTQGRLLERQADRAERVAAQSTRPARQAAADAARGAQRDHVNGAAAATGASAANAASATVQAACTASGTQAC